MDISVIIVSWNVRDLLKKCLESILEFSAPGGPDQPLEGAFGWEVFVVDNASKDGSVEMLEQNFDVIPAKAGIQESEAINSGSPIRSGMTIKLIRNSKNLGFAAANNQAIKEAKGDYILLLNSDTELIEETLQKVIAKMRRDETIGILGCTLLNPDRTLQQSVRRLPRVRDVLAILFKLQKLSLAKLYWYLAKDFDYEPHPDPLLGKERGPEAVAVDQVMGAFLCASKLVLDKIGLLDEGYFFWFEEVDFCRRAKQAGFKVVYWPGVSVVHHGGMSFSQQMSWKKQWWFFKSAWRYFTKQN